jgi:hypothetical protein
MGVRTRAHTPKCGLLHPEGRRGRQANIKEPFSDKTYQYE